MKKLRDNGVKLLTGGVWVQINWGCLIDFGLWLGGVKLDLVM